MHHIEHHRTKEAVEEEEVVGGWVAYDGEQKRGSKKGDAGEKERGRGGRGGECRKGQRELRVRRRAEQED